MLKSSVLVQCILWIFGKLNQFYEHSLIHRFFAWVGRGIHIGNQNSAILKSFKGVEEKMRGARTYWIVDRLLSLLSRLFSTIRVFLRNALEGSYLFRQIRGLSDVNQGFYGLSFLLIGFGAGLILIYLISQRRDGLYGLPILLMGLFVMVLSTNVRGIVENSVLGKMGHLFQQLIAMDEEVDENE